MSEVLNPDYLGIVAEPLAATWRAAEDDILKDICRRFKTSGATETALHQIRMLQRQGIHTGYIEARIQKALGITEKQLSGIFEDALKRNLEFDQNIKKAGLYIERDSGLLVKQTELIMEQTMGEFQNISKSLGFSVVEHGKVKYFDMASGYQKALDKAELKIVSGTTDYNTAISEAAKEITDSGIRRIHYPSGHSDQVDVAARRAGLTGVQQLSGRLADDTAEQLGTEIMELTAHAGARPSHKVWQGKLVDKTGRDSRYLTLSDIGYGDVGGFQGANCRHDWYPFVPGVSERTYTDEALEHIDPPPFDYQGKTYSAYEATQMQRRLERAIRKAKRNMLGYESAGLDQEFSSSAIRLKRLESEYQKFSTAAGLRTQPARAKVPGWGKSQAAKARKGQR